MSKPDGSKRKEAQQAAQERSSPGINSPVQTPKDVEPGDATAQDICERKVNSSDPDQRQQELLDEAGELSFPASDPPAVGGGKTRVEVPKQN